MFCGMVDHTGVLERIEKKSNSVLFYIRSKFSDIAMGESIAVDGICLTVTADEGDIFSCALSPETLNVTIANNYQPGQLLNLERAMRLNDRIGGHLVTGHVDETIVLENKIQHDEFIELRFADFSQQNLAYLITKGSVAINGVSLTVNAVDNTGFSVMLIPHTLERTNLSQLKINDRVNVEWDYVAKLVTRKTMLLRR